MNAYARKILIRANTSNFTWTAAGRLDAYRENGISLWDIAAGGLILECAGGEFWRRPLRGKYTYELIASNGRLRKRIERLI